MKRAALTALLLLCAALLFACAAPIRPHAEPASQALPPPADSPVWSPFLARLPADTPSRSWFSILNTGEEALLSRLASIDSAQVSIDAQYFLWLEDGVGSLLFARLLAAADRGVQVRLLLDDSFLAGEDPVVLALDSHPRIQVRIYNPFAQRSSSMIERYAENLHDFSCTNHRMHNKLLIADSTVAIIGGRNIADEYFGFGQAFNFRDFDVVATGAVVSPLLNAFDLFWNSGWAFPAPEVDHQRASQGDRVRLTKALQANASRLDTWQENNRTRRSSWTGYWTELAGKMIPGRASVLLDKPHFERQLPTQLADQLLQTYRSTDREVLAISAYLIMTEELLHSTRHLNDKGVHVRFLTNSLASTNHVAAHSAYRHHRKALLKTGAELFTLRPDAASRSRYEAPGFTAAKFGLHGKVVVLDHDKVFLGTLNLDPRSMFLNTEIGLLIESPQLNAAVREAFAPDFLPVNSWRLTLNEDDRIEWISHDGVLSQQPANSTGQRLMDWLFGLFPINAEM